MSDVPACGGCRYAESLGIPTLTYPIPKKGNYAGQGLSADELVATLTVGEFKVNYVILAGYLKVSGYPPVHRCLLPCESILALGNGA